VGPKGKPPITGPAERRDHLVSTFQHGSQKSVSVAYCERGRRVATGGDVGNSPPIPNVAPKIFRSMKLLMSKPKKYFSANRRKCLRNLLHDLVEPDQSTVVQQLSMINQTFCARGGNNRSFQVKARIFVRWAKMVKFHFFYLKLTKQPFLLNI